jgi:hypothetical protein
MSCLGFILAQQRVDEERRLAWEAWRRLPWYVRAYKKFMFARGLELGNDPAFPQSEGALVLLEIVFLAAIAAIVGAAWWLLT